MKSLKHNRSGGITWGFSLRRKNITCTSTVLQINYVFTPGSNTHIYPAELGFDIKVKITKKAHQQSKKNIFRSASAIVEDDIRRDGAHHIMFASLPQLQLLNHESDIYCDANFKVFWQYFCLLFRIHSFMGDTSNCENVYPHSSRRQVVGTENIK